MNKRFIKQLVPPILLNSVRSLSQKPIFSGRYASFEEASQHCRSGFESDTVVEAYVASYQALMAALSMELLRSDFGGRFAHLMAALSLALANSENKVLHVLDFGGSYGAYYEIARYLYPDVRFEWDIIETSKVVQSACRFGASETKQFYSDISDVKDKAYDICFASSALQYTPFPRQTLAQLAALDCNLYLITRFPLADFLAEDVVMLQQVPKSIYDASYPVWFFSPQWFDHFRLLGCRLLLQADVHMDTFNINGHVFSNKMFLLQKAV